MRVQSLQDLAGTLNIYYSQAHAYPAQWFAGLALLLVTAAMFLRRRGAYGGFMVLLSLACFAAQEITGGLTAKPTFHPASYGLRFLGAQWPLPFVCLLLMAGITTAATLIRSGRSFRPLFMFLIAYPPVLLVSLYFNSQCSQQRYNTYAFLFQGLLLASGLAAIARVTAHGVHLAIRNAAIARSFGIQGAKRWCSLVALALFLAFLPSQIMALRDAFASYKRSAPDVIQRFANPYKVAGAIAQYVADQNEKKGVRPCIYVAPAGFWSEGHRNLLFYVGKLLEIRALKGKARLIPLDYAGLADLQMEDGDLLAVTDDVLSLIGPAPKLNAVWKGPIRGNTVHMMQSLGSQAVWDTRQLGRIALLVSPENADKSGVAFPKQFVSSGAFALVTEKLGLQIPLRDLEPGKYRLVVVARGTKCRGKSPQLILRLHDREVLRESVPPRATMIESKIDLAEGDASLEIRMAEDDYWQGPNGQREDMNLYIERVFLLTLAP
jgi:hypothetical protein